MCGPAGDLRGGKHERGGAEEFEELGRDGAVGREVSHHCSEVGSGVFDHLR